MAESKLTGFVRYLRKELSQGNDRESLQAFLTRKDEAAFETLVRRHGPMVSGVCRRVLNDVHDAEDAFQATFLVLARKGGSIHQSESLACWLHGVAYRIAKQAHREIARRRHHERRAMTPHAVDAAEIVAWSDIQPILEEEIHSLPKRYREPFILCFLEGRSRADAASELGLNENTLSSRLARARVRLQSRLAQRGISLAAVLGALGIVSEGTSSVVAPTLLAITLQSALQSISRQPLTAASLFTQELAKEAVRKMTLHKIQLVAVTLALGTLLGLATSWGLSQGPVTGKEPIQKEATAVSTAREEKPAAKEPERIADFKQRQRSLSNLKQLMSAMQNYHDTNGNLPRDLLGKDGKPHLSWRVSLLPYLEYDNLYRQFKLDEAWDSEHNSKLIKQMPDVFRVGFEPKDVFNTYYQRFTFPQDKEMNEAISRLDNIIGTAKTLAIVEAGPAVPWTKPTDLPYTKNGPLPDIAWPFGNVQNVVSYLGFPFGFRTDLDEFTWRCMIEPTNRIQIPALFTFRAKFAANSEEEKKALEATQRENLVLLLRLQSEMNDQIKLQRLSNELAKGPEEAASIKDLLQVMLDQFGPKNQQMRNQLGIPRNVRIPESLNPPQKK